MRDWKCDFLACSAYKFYGPHIGILYGRHDLLDSLDFPKLIPAPDQRRNGRRLELRITKESPARPPRWIFSLRSLPARPGGNACTLRSGNFTSAATH